MCLRKIDAKKLDARMILEDQAESTKANFQNTAEIIDPAMPVVLNLNELTLRQEA